MGNCSRNYVSPVSKSFWFPLPKFLLLFCYFDIFFEIKTTDSKDWPFSIVFSTKEKVVYFLPRAILYHCLLNYNIPPYGTRDQVLLFRLLVQSDRKCVRRPVACFRLFSVKEFQLLIYLFTAYIDYLVRTRDGECGKVCGLERFYFTLGFDTCWWSCPS